MSVAIPVSFEITINFECEFCSSIISLHNREIPSKIDLDVVCPSCSKYISIPAMDINISELSAQIENIDNRTGVIKVLKNYGYSTEEINQMIDAIKDFSQDITVLLKIALANKEQ